MSALDSDSGVYAIVPVKRFAIAKGRLAPVLSSRSRASLARAMAAGVLEALAAQTCILRVDVLTVEPADALPLPTDARFHVRPDPRNGADGDALGSAIHAAVGAARAKDSGSRLLYLAADLPCIHAADLRHWLATRDANVALAPALRDGGVNAMVWPLNRELELELHPGPQSAARLRERAESLGWRVSVDCPTSLAFDLDTPGDWAQLSARREFLHPRVASALRELSASGRDA